MLGCWLSIQFMVYERRRDYKRYKENFFKLHRFAVASLSGTMGKFLKKCLKKNKK